MIRGLPTTVLSTCLAGIVGISLFFIKHEVKEQEARLSELNREIQGNQEVIHVLKAEWSYLNDPARLRGLSEKFLSMKVMGPSQIATLNSLPVSGAVYASNRAAPKAAPAAATASAPAVEKFAAVPAPQPPRPVASQPVRPSVFVAPPVKAAQSPALQFSAPPPAATAQAPARAIIIQSPALASTPALPGEVR
ncbi:MAG: energy transducer TonB [Magnetospirillum sp.]|nr:energy transducer TonB [Magnetospirillum sp.]